MSTNRKSRATVPLPIYGGEHADENVRQCEWPKCLDKGEFRAPHSRDELNVFRWFCINHVRKYNKSWNYYDGMSEVEVVEDVRRDTVWNRPTWQLGTKLGPDAFDKSDDPFGLFTNGAPGTEDTPPCPPISHEEERAYRTLELEYPVSADDVKSRYKSLVKEHHPDANKGTKASEERLKVINEAYSVLRSALNA
jgi:hypothetical protein